MPAMPGCRTSTRDPMLAAGASAGRAAIGGVAHGRSAGLAVVIDLHGRGRVGGQPDRLGQAVLRGTLRALQPLGARAGGRGDPPRGRGHRGAPSTCEATADPAAAIHATVNHRAEAELAAEAVAGGGPAAAPRPAAGDDQRGLFLVSCCKRPGAFLWIGNGPGRRPAQRRATTSTTRSCPPPRRRSPRSPGGRCARVRPPAAGRLPI